MKKILVVDDEETADDGESDPAHGPAVPHAFPDRRPAGNAAGRILGIDFMMVMVMSAEASRTLFVMMFVMFAHGFSSFAMSAFFLMTGSGFSLRRSSCRVPGLMPMAYLSLDCASASARVVE